MHAGNEQHAQKEAMEGVKTGVCRPAHGRLDAGEDEGERRSGQEDDPDAKPGYARAWTNDRLFEISPAKGRNAGDDPVYMIFWLLA